mmetsp:Transcript_24691/g.61785  ORF Transcript_24691/g.61785 Transcript_24691/m.61785 type:complete len:211 (+) Transcript_24691:30-662(+)
MLHSLARTPLPTNAPCAYASAGYLANRLARVPSSEEHRVLLHRRIWVLLLLSMLLVACPAWPRGLLLELLALHEAGGIAMGLAHGMAVDDLGIPHALLGRGGLDTEGTGFLHLITLELADADAIGYTVSSADDLGERVAVLQVLRVLLPSRHAVRQLLCDDRVSLLGLQHNVQAVTVPAIELRFHVLRGLDNPFRVLGASVPLTSPSRHR